MLIATTEINKQKALSNACLKDVRILYHFSSFSSVTAIAHDEEFREVQDWAVAPSSCRVPNQTMEGLKECVRCMMYGRKPQPIFIRHTQTSKSRSDHGWQKQDPDYCQKHFRSIRVNEHYKGKLKGRVVCVFDDYLTNGNTFESLRNLLVACQVSRIIFVSIGKFRSYFEDCYVQKSFTISGDVYTGRYVATFNGSVPHVATFNNGARRSLENLGELAEHLI